WVTREGCINSVPMSSHPFGAESGEAADVRYTQLMMMDLIAASWIPLDTCPYTQAFRNFTGTPCLIDNPDKLEDCGGHPKGCEHLKKVIEERRAAAKEQARLQAEMLAKMKDEDVLDLGRRLTQAFETIAAAAPAPSDDMPAPRRPNLKGK